MDPKSCPENWKNYLKPGIMKVSLIPEEQNLVTPFEQSTATSGRKLLLKSLAILLTIRQVVGSFKEKQLNHLQQSQQNRECIDQPSVSAISDVGSAQGGI
ncbi:hypothetical protein RDI58_012806 [Solanum bulbocastanum]|uniref:Uncharacterized protein n=1 Tax=Solanum bulbocastanum TaxID=147425 RepID=A0AAN8TPR7_SOLBU